MNIRNISAIATFAGAMLGMSEEARADFLVLCPIGGLTAVWTHTAGFNFAGPFNLSSTSEFVIPDTRFLNCHIIADSTLSLSYPNPGTCGGVINMSGTSPVFGRNEFFQSFSEPAFATASGNTCILEADVNFMTISVEMSEACDRLNSGLGWSCPDGARQIVRDFGGVVKEAPAE